MDYWLIQNLFLFSYTSRLHTNFQTSSIFTRNQRRFSLRSFRKCGISRIPLFGNEGYSLGWLKSKDKVLITPIENTPCIQEDELWRRLFRSWVIPSICLVIVFGNWDLFESIVECRSLIFWSMNELLVIKVLFVICKCLMKFSI